VETGAIAVRKAHVALDVSNVERGIVTTERTENR
jgi:hypothetical protein